MPCELPPVSPNDGFYSGHVIGNEVTAHNKAEKPTRGSCGTQCTAGALGEEPEGRNPRALGPEARRGGFGELGCVARRARWAGHFVPAMPRAKKPSKRPSKNAWERSRESRAASKKGERRALE